MEFSDPQYQDKLDFGKSKFRDREGILVDLERAHAQLIAMLKKNWFILSRRLFPLLLVVLLPIAAMSVFFLSNNPTSSDSKTVLNYPPIPLMGLGEIDVAHSDSGVQLIYSPTSEKYDAIMSSVAQMNGLDFEEDVIGFLENSTMKEYVARHLGKVQFAIFFIEELLWENYNGPLPVDADASGSQTSYTIFYNYSHNEKDRRSKWTKTRFPLLVLQKSLEHSILSVTKGANNVTYDASYGALWTFNPSEDVPLAGLMRNTTNCDLKQKDFGDLATAASWIFPFEQAIVGVIAFQLITEERTKHLFSMLRRLGLFDSVYWLSWFLTFLMLNILGSALAVAFTAAVSSEAYAFRYVDYSVIFTLFLIANTCSVCFGFFLASVSNTSSATTAVVLTIFITLVFTIAFCSTPLNSYTYDFYFDKDANQFFRVCLLQASSYNVIYSTRLLGNGFVEFITFFMPWFHIAQAITNIISIVQYEGEKFQFSDLHEPPQRLSYGGSIGDEFDSEWVEWSYGMMMASSLVYFALAWFLGLTMTSDVSEGRSFSSVFFPKRIRETLFYLFGSTGLFPDPHPAILEGDVRGFEKEKSFQEKSIHAYKVSKTFSSVQALKEISFTMTRGEVFVLLGHNGAGKSTLINILTGIYSPTHGSVYVSGLDVDEDISLIQQSIGVCPQADLLWEDLTAREHIDIHAAFKGIESGDLLDRAVCLILDKVGLLSRKDSYAKNFSGGMKRRLAVAMSVVGEVDAVFLDEPTTGLDPLSRHHIWNVINWLKTNKVVVLTTHNMEEADFLGDNILIMHEGKKKAFGNSLFLKETYGRGYQINLVTDQAYVPVVERVLKSSMPGSHFVGDGLLTGYISVNVSRRDVYNLPRFFAWLETASDAVENIREWGISNTTLEQVFLMHCKSSTEVNFVDTRDADDSMLCPMCRSRPKETVLVRNMAGQIFLLPESICAMCTITNENYFVNEQDFSTIQRLPYPSEEFSSTITRLLGNARDKATLQYLEKMHFNGPVGVNAIEGPLTAHIGADDGETNLTEDKLLSVSSETKDETKDLLPFSRGGGEYNSNTASAPDRKGITDIDSNDEKLSLVGEGALDVGLSNVGGIVPAMTNANSMAKSVNVAAIDDVANSSTSTIGKGNPHALVISTVPSQVNAILIKNTRLQAIQRCANICGILFVGLMFLMLYVFSLLFAGLSRIEQCGSGWVTFDGCSETNLLNHIFAGRDSSDPLPDSDTPTFFLGFKIQDYLIPTYSASVIQGFASSQIPFYEYHNPILWSSLTETAAVDYNGLYVRPIPNSTAVESLDSNSFMMANQMETFEAVMNNNNPRCRAFAPKPELYGEKSIFTPETWESNELNEEFSDFFATASFDCHTCSGKKDKHFFNGTLWQTTLSSTVDLYKYSFISLNGSFLSDPDVLLKYQPSPPCPENLAKLENNPAEFNSNTMLAMTLLNILTNTIYSPSVLLGTYPIQGAVSAYGELFFNIAGVNSFVSLFLSIFAILLMNGTWPLAVWRLSYERAGKITLMMKTVGMRPYAYVLGMYIFDMMIANIFGIGAMVGAVQLQFSRFKDAPLGYLVLTTVLSSHALNGLAVLLVQLYSKRSTLVALMSAVLSIACTIGSLILIIIKYPEEGDWHNAISIIPFFAQSRIVYLLLVYHRSSAEVDIALILLFFFGLICIGLALFLEYEISFAQVVHFLHFKCSGEKYCSTQTAIPSKGEDNGDIELGAIHSVENTGSRTGVGDAVNDGELCCSCMRIEYAVIPLGKGVDEGYDSASSNQVDPDVAREKELMRNLMMQAPRDSGESASTPPRRIGSDEVAIAISNVHYTYPVVLSENQGPKVLNGISLGIKYGECFGLLGPNGSGKTTLISSLSGYLKPSEGGAIYIAGENIVLDSDIIHSMVGVCPQEDIVWAELNVLQHLSFQARQRGIPSHKQFAEIQRVSVLVNLDGDALLTPASKLSGGMKRRLSIGMSIIGDPPILFLDECTAGLDPENKHQIWKIIQNLKNPSRCILLTTHSMEECETLCTRIGILVRGQLQCVGSSLHLKQKYGEGYSITINRFKSAVFRVSGAIDFRRQGTDSGEDGEPVHARSDQKETDNNSVTLGKFTNQEIEGVSTNKDDLDSFIIDEIGRGSGRIIAIVNNTRKYRIEKDVRTISDIFLLMEANKAKFEIREWGISMATLEEVFISAVERANEHLNLKTA